MRCNKRRARKVFHRIASRLPCEATAGPSCRRRRRGFERQPPCFTVPRYTTTPRLRHPFNSIDVFTDGDGVGQQTVRCCVWVGCGSATRCLCWCFDVGTSRLVGLRGQVSQPLFSDRGGFRSSEWDAWPLQLQRSTAIKDSMSPNSIPLPPERPSWKAQGPCWAWNPNDNIGSDGLFALARPHSSTESRIVPRTEGGDAGTGSRLHVSFRGCQQALCSARWGEKASTLVNSMPCPLHRENLGAWARLVKVIFEVYT